MPNVEIGSPPANDDQLQSWSFAHMAQHRDINRRIMELYNTRVDEFPLDPFFPEEDAWFDLHQQMHNQQNKVLGIAGYTLIGVDWQNTDDRENWVWAHADEHDRAATILGL